MVPNFLTPQHFAGFRELFAPKAFTVLSKGYSFDVFKADATAGLIVAIVALPLSMAIAIACGAKPEQGLYTAIVGGFIISALGGSRYQIGGPAGAFIVLIVTTIQIHGYDGFLLATFLAGLFLAAIGLLRLGVYIKYIPLPVRVGFTAGIGVILLSSQITDLFGLTLPSKEPAAFLPKLEVLFHALPSWNPATVLVSAVTLTLIVGIKRYRPGWPSLLIAVVVAALITRVFGLDVETIGTRYGGVPSSLPLPHMPEISWSKIGAVLPAAATIALLGGIESLLSAVVADSMTGKRHRSNCELVAQGIANCVCALFGGLCATGTIARTSTNVRAGAVTPVAGMMHSLFLLIFMLVAAPLASSIPLAALAGILTIVSLNMVQVREFINAFRRSRGESVVLFTTFFLTVFRDLTEGIAVGVLLGSLIFMHRMARLVTVETENNFLPDDQPDVLSARGALDDMGKDRDILVYHFQGPLFFGATTSVGVILERIGWFPKAVVMDFSSVPLVDTTGIETLVAFVQRIQGHGGTVYVAGAPRPVRKALMRCNFPIPNRNYFSSVETAEEYIRSKRSLAGRVSSGSSRKVVAPATS
ncbi:MAG: SulP family inorganic anion transporter [Methylobacteriaceae bacterium]|jgi:SulP family sulfate permease|nr:SulP family inorganic anion transporter [Methylobacteriaceae bacterium]